MLSSILESNTTMGLGFSRVEQKLLVGTSRLLTMVILKLNLM